MQRVTTIHVMLNCVLDGINHFNICCNLWVFCCSEKFVIFCYVNSAALLYFIRLSNSPCSKNDVQLELPMQQYFDAF